MGRARPERGVSGAARGQTPRRTPGPVGRATASAHTRPYEAVRAPGPHEADDGGDMRKNRRSNGASPTDEEIDALDAHWRAANYLAVGQIYLMDNPLLRKPLEPEHIKPRLLGHWGTSPGLNLVHTHLNRVIRNRGLDALCVWGPGHGSPAVVANSWLEGSYSEVYPDVSRDEEAWPGCSGSSPSPAGCRATWRPRPPVRSTRAASWATPCPTPTVPPSTTRTSWWPASSVTARRRRGRSPRPGTRTSSSTPSTTGPSYRSCTSTATRSRTPPCSPGSPRRSSTSCCAATATNRCT